MNLPADSSAGADAELLERIAIAGAGMAAVLTTVRLALDHSHSAPTLIVTVVCTLALVMCVVFARYPGTAPIAAYLLPAVPLGGSAAGAALEGGLASIPALWLPFVPVLAVFTLGVRARWPATLAALSVLTLLLVRDLSHPSPTLGLNTSGPVELRFLVICMNAVFGGMLASAYHAQRRRAETSLRYHATHDALTDLPNRRAFFQRLERVLPRGTFRAEPVAVIMADLDDFKAINDQHGHAAGDLVLREVAARLKAGVRSSEQVFRLAGDEFVVLIEDAGKSDLSALCGRVERLFSVPTVYRGISLPISVSIGIARSFPGCTARDLLEKADASMYQDKRARGISRSGPITIAVRDKETDEENPTGSVP